MAIALVGNPPIILLDEPSAGMDPEARRFMWSVVGDIAEKRSSAVVLTTHSMDEAEALSSKMGIMVKGGIFKCMGSSQHIKNKFGTGFAVEVKIRALSDNELANYNLIYFTPEGQVNADFFNPWLEQKLFDDWILAIGNSTSKSFEDKIKEIHAATNLLKCMHELSKIFNGVDLLEKYDSYMKVRVKKLDKTIGWLFGEVE